MLERWKPLECPRRAAPTGDGGKRMALANVQGTTKPREVALRGLRALSKVLRAATVHAALIQSVLETLKAAACKRLDG